MQEDTMVIAIVEQPET